jgi:hypothetical protein
LTNTEQIIEAISYAEEDGSNWWDAFDSTKQAKQILTKAIREEADEYQMIDLLEAKSVDMFDSCTVEEAYNRTLNKLRQEIS